MKKLFILSILLFSCHMLGDAQKKHVKTYQERLEEAWQQLKISSDSTRMLIRDIKQLANQKVIYRTKLVERTDTVWRIDTCISIITKLDSERIAVMFQNREVPKETKRGKRVFFFFRKKNKSK